MIGSWAVRCHQIKQSLLRSRQRWIGLFFLYCLSIAPIVQATAPIEILANQTQINITAALDRLESDQSIETFDQAITAFHAGKSTPIELNPNQNLLPQFSWLRFSVINRNASQTTWLLDAGKARIAKVYQVDENGQPRLIEKNYGLGTSDNLTLILKPNQKTELIFFYTCSFPNKINFIQIESKIALFSSPVYLMYPIYFGVIVSIFILNFYLYCTTRYGYYIKYCGYLVLILLSTMLEIIQSYLAYDLTLIVRVNILTAMIFALLFMMDVLQTKTYTPKVHIIAKITVFSFFPVFFTIYYFPPDKNFVPQILGLFSYLVLIMGGIGAWRRRVNAAVWYCLSWGCFVFFNTIAIITQQPNFYLPGIILECTLLSLMLAHLINEKRKNLVLEKKSRMEAFEDLSYLKLDLEKRIAKRTIELEEKNIKLNDSIQELKSTQAELIEVQKMADLGKLLEKVASSTQTPVKQSFSAVTHTAISLSNLEQALKTKTLTGEQFENGINLIKTDIPKITENLKKTCATILTFKQVAVQEFVDEVSTFSLTKYIDDVLKSFYANDVHIDFQIHGDQNVQITGYQGVIYQAVTRIIDNAKQHAFADVANPKIDITITKHENSFRLAIQDNGKGVDVSEVKAIFEPFYALDKSTGSTGLGLHILKNLVVHRLHGHIYCQSETGKSLTVIIEAPLTVLKAQAA